MVTLKTKKVICECGGAIKPKRRDGDTNYTMVMVYTRAGSDEGRHYESRLVSMQIILYDEWRLLLISTNKIIISDNKRILFYFHKIVMWSHV